MSDDLKKVGPQDAGRINLSEEYEVAYWTKALNVTEVELRKAVKRVGTDVVAVRTYLASGTGSTGPRRL